MSLINQMLKDLDARRAEIGGGAPFGGQVRAVAERRGVHPAWWVALALGVVLVAVVVWVLLRPPVVDPYLVQVQLPLKLEAGLSQLPVEPSAPQSSPETVSTLTAGAAAESALAADAVRAVNENSAAAPAAAAALVQPQPLHAAAAPAVVSAPPSTPPASAARIAQNVAPRPLPGPTSAPDRTASAPAARSAPSAREDEDRDMQPVVKQARELTLPQRAENEFRKATLAMQQGRAQEAVAGFELALQLDARLTSARHALIAALLDLRRQDEALRRAREGLDIDTRQPGLAMIAARLQLEKDDLRGAIDTLERTRTHAAERSDYLAFLAALLQRDGRHREAAEQYLIALQKSPQNGVWWMGLGISLQAEQRNAEAQEAYKRARSSNTLTPDLAAFVESRLSQLR